MAPAGLRGRGSPLSASGRIGDSSVALPICDSGGQVALALWPSAASVAVQACSVPAPARFSVTPSGSVRRSCAMSAESASAPSGTRAVSVSPSGASEAVVSAASCSWGANGTFSQPSTADAVAEASPVCPPYDCTVSAKPVLDAHALGSVSSAGACAIFEIQRDSPDRARLGSAISRYSW